MKTFLARQHPFFFLNGSFYSLMLCSIMKKIYRSVVSQSFGYIEYLASIDLEGLVVELQIP